MALILIIIMEKIVKISYASSICVNPRHDDKVSNIFLQCLHLSYFFNLDKDF